MKNRIRNKSLRDKIISADEAAAIIKSGMTIGCSGFTPSGYPKAVPLALVEKAQGEDFNINILTGASVGSELDGALAEAGLINRRYPYQSDKNLRSSINSGDVKYSDIHLSHFPQNIRYGHYGDIDLAIVEAIAITEEGWIVPSSSVGAAPTFLKEAEKIIVELNLKQTLDLEGVHDIYQLADPPEREAISLVQADQRIGSPYIKIDPKKIEGIVITEIEDEISFAAYQDDISNKIASHIIDFLEAEQQAGKLPKELLPLQSGVGAVANAVLSGLCNSNFENIKFYSEVIQDAVLELIDCGKIDIASGTSITLSESGKKQFKENIDLYKDKIILRPQEISNNPEIIRRLGSIAINTAIEADIYGNVNSTHIMGSRMMNGIGGSGDFARNAYLSIFVTSSVAKGGKISSIVPMVSHVDHTEHDVDIIVTEQGLADLRGLSPQERAVEIITKAVSPLYKDKLLDYFERAKNRGGHTPVKLNEALSWHQRYIDTGTMK
ncbi:acetyl-CoA hydrolase/transferase family protein [Halanaerobiaceae bacterium Z-7014]|uniref:Acetyl-CoA hydrolase/transferase family protein n=1 Tax=Halonatronomonas betaini TaxID=2778430 RepID=A0A931AMP3_9FIRM|nr:acetyl-CoA hydrolase/transferase family protein [Halonatronomonas betaini]MBF8435618.1 acetyl-CoA hydrolase/transferase family protein [Halonatronomonas betaini]